MKVLFFTDTHSNKREIMNIVKKSKKADLVVCLGDVSFFEQAIDLILKDLEMIDTQVLMLPGNHEDEDTLKELCDKTKNIIYLHEETIEINGVTFFAYGSGGFLIDDPHFDDVVKKHQREILEAEKLVLLTHQPPFNTKIDQVNKKSVGNINIKDFIKEYRPLIAAAGHIHDNFDKEEKVGETLVINPGPKGKIIEI